MLTPRFSLSQDADFVYIHITAPYIKVSESECYIQDDEFYFYSQPYYLRLHLPGQIVENELSTSKYDVDTGQLTVRVAKETKGETFEGLDMLTKLLTPKAHACRNREIEVLGNSDEQPCDSNSKINEAHGEVSDDEAADDDDEFDWFLEQKINELPCHVLTKGPSYGFAHRKSNVLQDLITGLPELLDLKDPDHVPSNERRALRELQENEQFNCEHYLADLFDDEVIKGLVLPDYPELTGTAGEETVFNEAEKEKLRQLPRREYIISDSELKITYLGLVDLVFAYAYNFRFTQGEGNVESDWTICKLSSTLSWLDSFDNIQDVVVSCARRSLCFPLYRSWDLFTRVLNDVKTIFMMGRSQVLKCLLGIHTILKESETRYPLNDLYIVDYCVWLQSADSKRIESLGKALEEVKLLKADLGLRLEEMEADARKLTDECQVNTYCHSSEGKQGDIERLAEALSDIVNIKDSVADSDDDECDSKDEDSESDDDECDSKDEDSESDEESTESDEESTDSDETDNEIGSDESEESTDNR